MGLAASTLKIRTQLLQGRIMAGTALFDRVKPRESVNVRFKPVQIFFVLPSFMLHTGTQISIQQIKHGFGFDHDRHPKQPDGIGFNVSGESF